MGTAFQLQRNRCSVLWFSINYSVKTFEDISRESSTTKIVKSLNKLITIYPRIISSFMFRKLIYGNHFYRRLSRKHFKHVIRNMTSIVNASARAQPLTICQISFICISRAWARKRFDRNIINFPSKHIIGLLFGKYLMSSWGVYDKSVK